MRAGVVVPLAAVLVALGAAGCATQAPLQLPERVVVHVVQPCPAALEAVPEAPLRTLELDVKSPGAAAQQYAANRTQWVGYADALQTRLNACK